MLASRLAVTAFSAVVALGLVVSLGGDASAAPKAKKADKKKKKGAEAGAVSGELTALEAGYQVKGDDGKVLLEGTKVQLHRKVKKGTNAVADPFFVQTKTTEVVFETADKELKSGQWVTVYFEDGSADPAKQGLAKKIVVSEAPKKAKAKKAKKPAK
jgi:hypothetical protein